MFKNSDSSFNYQRRQWGIRIKFFKAFSNEKVTQTRFNIPLEILENSFQDCGSLAL